MSAEGTERKRFEASLSESEERFQAIFAQAAVGIAQIGLNGEWLLVNNKLCEMLRYSEDELRSKTLQDITHPGDWNEALAGRNQLLGGEIPSHTMEKRYVCKDGTIFWGRLHRSLVRDPENLPRYFISVIEDITEKIRTERALRGSEQLLTLAQNAAHLGLWDRDLRTNIITSSGEYAGLYGLAADRPAPTYEEWLRLVHPEDRKRVQEVLQEALEHRCPWDVEFRVHWPDESEHWVCCKGMVYFDDSGQPVRAAGVNFDITERKRAESALRESEERFRRVFEEGPLGLALVGKDYHFLKVNGALCQMVGYSEAELLRMSFPDITHPDDLRANVELAEKLFKHEIPFYQLQKRYVRRNGEVIWIKLTASVIRDQRDEALYGLGMIEDMTEIKRTQEEALARQKLESLGVLAGGIAHDFNNLLGGILAEAELVEADLPPYSSPLEEIQRIKQSALRGSEIVRELMIYAGQNQTVLVEAVDISRLAEEMLELLKVSISKHAVLRTVLHDNLPAVHGNAAQIRQVVMNLVINASEAIGEKQGVITVTTAQVTGSENLAFNGATILPQGDYVRLQVSDTGCGMTEAVKAKIFDPFFSTKFAGRGLGLGVVQGIVRGHGGTIDLKSSPGEGTTFQVFLPCTPQRVAKIHRAIRSSGVGQSKARTGTILVVEDEETLRLAVSTALRKSGFSVMEANDGSSAMELLRTHTDEIDAILLDVTLPGIASREIFEEAQRIRPDLKVIVTSAYSKETVDASFAGLAVEHFIRKPFRLADIARLLGGVLSAESRPGHKT